MTCKDCGPLGECETCPDQRAPYRTPDPMPYNILLRRFGRLDARARRIHNTVVGIEHHLMKRAPTRPASTRHATAPAAMLVAAAVLGGALSGLLWQLLGG